jgi:hypothetical protein
MAVTVKHGRLAVRSADCYQRPNLTISTGAWILPGDAALIGGYAALPPI